MDPAIRKKMRECEDTLWYSLGMDRIVMRLMDMYIDRPKNFILDIGCDTGRSFRVLSRYGDVVGVDKAREAREYADVSDQGKIFVGDAAHLPFDNNSFHIVTCFDVLYHRWVADDVGIMREAYRVLKSGGLFILKEPAFDWLRSQHDVLYETRHRYTRRELIQKLKAAGFSVQKSTYANFLLFPLAVFTRIIEKFFTRLHSIDSLCADVPVFKYFLFTEAWFLRFVSFPFGLSILCVAKK
ncbi:MAG TPA: hypothetical protein DIS62_01360 [Candidatus Kerfeldbacteria bacterium]|nr:hypothetical protein [Candidatus Kerfeldbacteria bacterium]